MKIALIGHGRMGQEIARLAEERHIGIGAVFTSRTMNEGAAITPSSLHGVDMVIDFSSPAIVVQSIEAVAAAGVNMVVGTTGWHDRIEHVKRVIADSNTGFLYSPNFSLGVNIFTRIVAEATRLFDRYPGYDVALREAHHAGKADSPSGTALALAATILRSGSRKTELLTGSPAGAVKPQQLQVSSMRAGHLTGRHDVVFDSEADTIELIHTARNRTGFALGALVAAEWLSGKKGFFTMQDVVAP